MWFVLYFACASWAWLGVRERLSRHVESVLSMCVCVCMYVCMYVCVYLFPHRQVNNVPVDSLSEKRQSNLAGYLQKIASDLATGGEQKRFAVIEFDRNGDHWSCKRKMNMQEPKRSTPDLPTKLKSQQ